MLFRSDHGQVACTPYRDLTGGRRLEQWIFDEFLDPMRAETSEPRARFGLTNGVRARREGTPGLLQRFLNYLDEDFLRRRDPEAHEQDGVRVIAAGPNAFFYVLDVTAPLDADALEQLFPGLAEDLSRSRGVGIVLARSGNGPVCFCRGKRYGSASPSRGHSRGARTPRSSFRASKTSCRCRAPATS